MKYLCLLTIVFALLSCVEDSTSPEDAKSQLFDVQVGKVWEYGQGNDFSTLTVKDSSMQPWVLHYWNTTKIDTLKTWRVEFAFHENSLTRYQDFAIAETDSGYVWGTNKHTLIDKYMNLPYYVRLIDIPRKFSGNYKQQEAAKLSFGGQEYEATIDVDWIAKYIEFAGTINRKAWDIKFTHQRKVYEPGIEGDNYTIVEDVGFYMFRSKTLSRIYFE